jgi:HD-like signal output (HDOD) protein
VFPAAIAGRSNPAYEHAAKTRRSEGRRCRRIVRKLATGIVMAAVSATREPVSASPAANAKLCSPLARVMDGISLQVSMLSTAQGVRSLSIIASNYDNSLAELSQHILANPALTESVLKCANSAHLGVVGGVSDVARAVLLLGFDAVRTLALAVALLENVRDPRHQATISAELARTLASSTVARELAAIIGADAERACLEATLRSLGRMLVAAHAPDMLPVIRTTAAQLAMSEDLAAARVLGASLTAISTVGAQSWNVTDEFLASLGKGRSDLKLSALAAATAVEVTEAAWLSGSLISPQVRSSLAAFGAAAGCGARALDDALDEAQKKFDRLACAMGLPTAMGAPAEEVFDDLPGRKSATGTFRVPPSAETDDMGRPRNYLLAMNSAIMEVAERAASGEPIDSLMTLALDAMHQLAGYQRAVLFFRDATATRSWRARIAIGADAERVKTTLYMPSFEKPHLLSSALERDACLAIADTSVAKVVKVLPTWFLERLPGARSFILLPLVIRGRSIGGIYADRNCVDTSNGEEELRLLVAMRNNLVLAVKASSN